MAEVTTFKGLPAKQVDGRPFRVAIVYARWNLVITSALVDGARKALLASGVVESNIHVYEVPGSFELPFAASRIVEAGKVDAVICVGCLIKGETMHFEYISGAVSDGIMQLGLKSGIPVIFGVLTCLTETQAQERAGLVPGKGHNHGSDWGSTAVEMAALKKALLS